MTPVVNDRRSVTPVAHRHRYAGLYQAMILRAVQDLAYKHHRDDARAWLLSAASDSAFATAGISPQTIRQQIL